MVVISYRLVLFVPCPFIYSRTYAVYSYLTCAAVLYNCSLFSTLECSTLSCILGMKGAVRNYYNYVYYYVMHKCCMNLLDYLFYICHFHSAASFKTAPEVLCVVHHPHSVKIACQRSINWRTMWEQTSAVEETAARSPPLFLLSISNLFVLYLSMCLNLHPLF